MCVYECVLLLRCALRLVTLCPRVFCLGSLGPLPWFFGRVRSSADLGPWFGSLGPWFVSPHSCRNLNVHVAGERDSHCAKIVRMGHYAVSRIAQLDLACIPLALSAVGLLVLMRLGLHLLRQMAIADCCPTIVIASPLPASALRWAGVKWRHGMHLADFIPWRVWMSWWVGASTYQRSGRCNRVGV